VVIVDYFARLDGPDPMSGLELAEPDVEFLLALPDPARPSDAST
jgi:hypothetical protein